jgi:uncharacterized membrane protein YagU involved in acid resistance
MSATASAPARSSAAASTGRAIALPFAMVGDLVTRGAVAGFSSGLVFLAANMGWAVHNGKPAVAPMIDISTIFNTQEMPAPTTAVPFGPENVVVGLVTHATLSVLFGIVFAVVAASVVRRSSAILPLAGISYGLLLYVINFQVLGRTAFPWFTNAMGPPQGFEVFIHGVFGLLLVPFLIGSLPCDRGRRATDR